MKKRFSLLLVALFTLSFSFPARAATFTLDQIPEFEQNTIASFSTLRITAEAENEITPEQGLSLTLAELDQVLWQSPQTLTLSGSAVEAGRMKAGLEPTLSTDKKTLHLPVLENFLPGEQVFINGLQLRTYTETISNGTVELDLNGDQMPEKTLFNAIKIESVEKNDWLAPYSPTELTALPDFEESRVSLSWVKPPDYDYVKFTVHKGRVGDDPENLAIVAQGSTPEFIDEDLKEGDQVIYRVYAYDQVNQSPAAEIRVDFTPPVTPEPTPEEPIPPPEPPVEEPPVEPAPTEPEVTSGFSDITPTDWFFKAVVYGEKEPGYFDAGEKFNPHSESNRAQYAKLLAAFIGSEASFTMPPLPAFDDVPLDHWAAKSVYSLVEQGALTGYKDAQGNFLGTFGLADVITREQAFAALVRALELPIDLTGGSPFTDLTESDWSYPLIVTAYNAGLTEGQTPTFFNKNVPLNRAELAQMFYNAAQWLASYSPITEQP